MSKKFYLYGKPIQYSPSLGLILGVVTTLFFLFSLLPLLLCVIGAFEMESRWYWMTEFYRIILRVG